MGKMGNKSIAGIGVFQDFYCQHGPECEEGLHLQKAESLQGVCHGSTNTEWPHFSHVLGGACFYLPSPIPVWMVQRSDSSFGRCEGG